MAIEEKTKYLKIDPPESIHSDFKKLTFDFDTSMRGRIMALMELDINNWKYGVDTLKEGNADIQQAKRDCQVALACWKILLEGRVPPEPELIKLCAIFNADAAELRTMLRKAINGRTRNGL